MVDPTQTPAEFANASTDVISGFGSTQGLAPAAVFVLFVAVVLVAFAPALAEYRIIGRVVTRFGTAFGYALKGLVAVVVLGVLSAPITVLATADASTRTYILEYAAIAIGGFVGLAVVGYIADYAVARYIDAHPEYEAFSDIFPDSDETEAEVAADGGEEQ